MNSLELRCLVDKSSSNMKSQEWPCTAVTLLLWWAMTEDDWGFRLPA